MKIGEITFDASYEPSDLIINMIIEELAPPSEMLQGYDDRILYDEAVAVAKELGENGKRLMEALEAFAAQHINA